MHRTSAAEANKDEVPRVEAAMHADFANRARHFGDGDGERAICKPDKVVGVKFVRDRFESGFGCRFVQAETAGERPFAVEAAE